MAKNRKINASADASNSFEFRRLRTKDRRLIKLCYKKAYEVYGKEYDKPHWTRSLVEKTYKGKDNDFLPKDVMENVNRGLREIIGNGDSALYLDQAKLIKKHGQDKCREVFRPKEDDSFVGAMLLS